MSWVDSHCHLDHKAFADDLTHVLQQAMQAGIDKFIVPGTAFHAWEQQQALEQKYPNIYLAYGIHPWFCDLHTEEHLEKLDDLLDDAVAVGECGLDLSPNKPDTKQQSYWFEAQLGLATKHDLPVIVHSVQAHHLVTELLAKHSGLRGVIHGFAGNINQAQTFMKHDFKIGIGTRLIKAASDKTKLLLTELPLEHILLETDAPDGLGKDARNEPKELLLIAKVMAKLRNQDAHNILDVCSKNAQELFKL